MSYWKYPKYVTVAEKKAKAEKQLKQLKKKMPDIKPVVLEGNTLARTWWGKSWNTNLERYADYDNRIDRGRSYVRHGAVLDLKITPGHVRALVMGSGAKPYEVIVTIKPLEKAHWQEIQKQCEGQLKSLQDLLAGKFPKTLADIFFNKESGLFPTPKTISFDCSCPDWASMCKHVAATLYGVGARFDEDPSLFFTLRGVDTKDLIAKAVEDTADKLLAKTKTKRANVLDDANLSDIFGIDMDITPDFSKKKPTISPGVSTKTKKKVPAKKQKKSVGNFAKKQTKQGGSGTATSHVADVIAASPEGINVGKLVEATGFTKTKIYGIVHQLKKQGKITTSSHGVYIKV